MKIHKITPLVGRGGAGLRVPGRPGAPARGRGAPPPADRRAGPDQRDPRPAQPVLETRAGARRSGVTGAAGHLPSRAPPGRRAQRPAVAGKRGQPLRDRRGPRPLPRQHPGQNMEQLRRMREGRPGDAGYRSGVLRAIRAQSMEFSELNVEYGCRYQSAAVVPDGSTAPAPADEIRVYQPSTRPGSPLPHAWVDDEDGHRRPVKDLVAPGRFLLIAGEDGHAWCQAARQLAAEAGVPLDAVRIGHLDGDLYDPRCAWLRHRQIASDGAVLVRPDRFHRLAPPGRHRRPPGRARRRAQPERRGCLRADPVPGLLLRRRVRRDDDADRGDPVVRHGRQRTRAGTGGQRRHRRRAGAPTSSCTPAPGS